MSDVGYCKQCGAMIEPDIEIAGYGVRCKCAGKEYYKLQTELDKVIDAERKKSLLADERGAELTSLRQNLKEARDEIHTYIMLQNMEKYEVDLHNIDRILRAHHLIEEE